jgi:DNA-binding NarL/FixJ family response regulator
MDEPSTTATLNALAIAQQLTNIIEELTTYLTTNIRPRNKPTFITNDALTDRQLEVLNCLGQRMTNQQIARRIGYSESTVRQETMHIYRFLDVPDRAGAVSAATEQGLIKEATPLRSMRLA